MQKACIKKDLKNLENEIDDLIMLEDSARGTLCAIHKTIHSSDNFPCSTHKMLRLCPVPRPYNLPATRIPISRFRRNALSISPSRDRPKICRTLSANQPCTRPCCAGCYTHTHNSCRSQGVSEIISPSYHTSEYIKDVEKTLSCPEKMCCHKSLSNKTSTVASRSSFQIDKFAQNLMNTDEVVTELKGEIERVKQQINHISQQKVIDATKHKTPPGSKLLSSKADEDNNSSVYKLKNDNKRLRREIEAKKKLLEKAKGEVEKAKEILTDYEQKVSLLHVQALKSSKAMKISKDKFCSCLKDREERIKSLKETNQNLETVIQEKDSFIEEKNDEINKLNEDLEKLKKSFEETCEKCSVLTESNQNFYESIELLRNQLFNSSAEIESHKETIKLLEQKLSDLNNACKKVMSNTKKQKEFFENQVKTYNEEKTKMSETISELSTKLEEMEQHKNCAIKLESKCEDFLKKINEYEKYSEKCKSLEEECKGLFKKLVDSEGSFQKDKEEMTKLVDELTTVVKRNKVTITQMTEINTQQEKIIKTQNTALLTKEEQLKLIEKESEDFKIINLELKKEVEELKRSFSEPCNREACLCVSKELEEIRNALNVEKDTQLMKEKIIEDQSQTILNLQNQVKEKMFELNKAQSDTMYLEDEISKINDKLIKKHKELDREVDEKENLIEKLRILECQKNQLTEEINDFEDMLQGFKKSCGDNERQQRILRHLENQIKEQKEEWEVQKEAMAQEKKKAVCVAKFATQKLLDTVADFQRQVEAQKKVQVLLTKMLYDKDEQLRIVTSKISDINHMTKDIAGPGDNISMKELFFRKTLEKLATSEMNVNTNTSMYSSCSSCCRRSDCIKHEKHTKTEKSCGCKCNKSNVAPYVAPCALQCLKPRSVSCATSHDTNQIVQFLKNSTENVQEEPIRDLS